MDGGQTDTQTDRLTNKQMDIETNIVTLCNSDKSKHLIFQQQQKSLLINVTDDSLVTEIKQ